MCQIQKTGIEVRADLVTHTDACKMAWFKVEDKCDNLFDIANKYRKAKIDSLNINW